MKILTLLLMIFATVSCNIRSKQYDCGIYLDFVFDLNMEYADAFRSQVKTVDVYFFNNEGQFVMHKHAASADLIDGKMMFINDNLHFGKYRVLTVGGLNESFEFIDNVNKSFKAGESSIEEVKLALRRENSRVSHEFSHLWFATTVDVEYKADLSVWHVNLVRNTNNFNLLLESSTRSVEGPVPSFTFEIESPEGGAYDFRNEAVLDESIVYTPYYLSLEPDNSASTSVARINTMRLFARKSEYRLVVRNTDSGKELWNYDLISLLENIKPDKRPDGTPLPMQEFLDRQGEWNIVVLHKAQQNPDEGFVAIAVKVNGWILWLNDIGI